MFRVLRAALGVSLCERGLFCNIRCFDATFFENRLMATIRNRSIEIVPVKTRRQWQSFHGLPQRLRGADSRWIQPLRLQVRQAWAPRQPYFRHASAAAWIAIEADRVVGRISAQVDSLDQQLGRAGRGQFGQLEAVDDAEVFQRLTDIAGGWLKAHGMTDMLGPFDLSINQQCGVLVDGFEHAPMMMMNHNPEYYPSRLEQAGFEPAAEMLAYRGSPDCRLPPRVARLLERMQGRLEIRPVPRGELTRRAETMRELFNAAWAENWGFVPITEEEFRHMVQEMKLLIRPGYVQLAFYEGRPAGFIVALPDLNELIADLNGRLLPTGAVRLLWRIARRRSRKARIPLMGIDPAFQQSLPGAGIAYALIESARRVLVADGIEETEQSWILRQNKGMRSMIEAIGMRAAQTFRIYERPLSE